MLLIGNDLICTLLSLDGLSGNFMSNNGLGKKISGLLLLSLLLEAKLRYR